MSHVASPAAGKRTRKRVPFQHDSALYKSWEPYVWLLPSLVLMCIFIIFPIFVVFSMSLSSISSSGVVGGFVGLENFRAAISHPAFGVVMSNTAIWVVAVVGLSTLIGFVVAMVLNAEFFGRKLARAIVVFPWATALVVQASIWNYIIKFEYGNLNNVLLNLGLITNPINWRNTYQIEFIWECAVGIFVTIPFVAFTCLAGLQSIDAAYYEAATVDGAGFWKKLRHITIPLLRPSLTISTVLNIIYVFNSFPIIFTITKGAPAHKTDTMVTFLYMLAYYEQDMGAATALSVIGFLILTVVAGAYMILSMRKEDAA